MELQAGWRNYIREVTCCLLIASPVPLILRPLSPLRKPAYKSRRHAPASSPQIENSGHLLALSSHLTNPGFFTARQEAYRGTIKVQVDPMYFEERSKPPWS